jgi:hypothetical protein
MKNSEKLGYSNIQNSVANTYQVPTEIVDLPSKGKLYPQDHPLRDVESVEIKFMTTREEDLLISPSLNEKGVAIDRVIESLVISHKVNAASMIAGDKNAVLMAARKSAYGSEYQFQLSCPHCTTNNIINASLDNVQSKEIVEDESARYSEEGNMIINLPKSGAVVEIRILSTDDERIIEETTKKRLKNNLPAEELLTRYRRMFVSVNGSTDTSVINNFINNLLGIADSRFLRKKYLDLAPDISFTYTSKCSGCGEPLEGGVPIGVDFFWPKL